MELIQKFQSLQIQCLFLHIAYLYKILQIIESVVIAWNFILVTPSLPQQQMGSAFRSS